MNDEVFPLLQSILKKLSTSPTPDSLNELKDVLLVLAQTPWLLQNYQEYVLLPLHVLLKLCQHPELRNEKRLEKILDCLRFTFSHTRVEDWSKFSDFLVQLVLHIDSEYLKTKDNPVWSEEVQNLFVKTIYSLLRSSKCPTISNKLFDEKGKQILAHSLFNLTRLAGKEKLTQLRLDAMLCIREFITLAQDADQTLALSAFRGFLPGIVSGMDSILRLGDQEKHAVLIGALQTLTVVVCFVFQDQRSDPSEDLQNLANMDSETPDSREKLAKQNMGLVFERVCMLHNHCHPLVRRELAKTAGELWNHCYWTLCESLRPMIQMLVGLTVDSIDNVSETATQVLATLEKENLPSLLRQNLYNMCQSAPRIVIQGTSEEQSVMLGTLEGHLKLLGPDLELTLQISCLSDKLIKSLLQISLLSTETLLTETDGISSTYQLAYLNDQVSAQRLRNVLRCLGEWGDFMLISDLLMDLFREDHLQRKEVIFLLNHMILGCKDKKNEESFAMFDSITTEYLESGILELPIVMNNSLTLGKLRSNILQVILVLEGFAAMAQVLQVSFTPLLLHTLVPVLGLAGQTRCAVVSHTALQTLHRIATHINQCSLSEFLGLHSDYIMPQLAYQIRHLTRFRQAPSTLHAILQHSQLSLLPLVQEATNFALKALDQCHNDSPLPFVQIFVLYLQAINKNLGSSSDQASSPRSVKTGVEKAKSVVDSLRNRHFDFERSLRLQEETEEDSKTASEDDLLKDDSEPNLQRDSPQDPSYVTLTCSITDRMIQLLTRPDFDLKTAVIESLHLAFVVLAKFKNQLLPKAHALWKPLVYQFRLGHVLLLRTAWELLMLLCEKCGDFLRQRTVKEILPQVKRFLRDKLLSSKVGERAGKAQAYKFTQNFKLQSAILESLGKMMCCLKPPVIELTEVVNCVIPYVSTEQIAELQIAAKSCLMDICEVNANLVWLALYQHGKSRQEGSSVGCLQPVNTNLEETKEESGSNSITELIIEIKKLY